MLADFVQSTMGSPWAPLLALAAGVVAFASPCVFPLVPGYVSFVAGVEVESRDRTSRQQLVPVLLFVAGFSTVFVLFGVFSSTLAPIFKLGGTGQIIAGSLVLLFGCLMLLYALRKGPTSLYAERRPLLGKVRPGVAGAFPLGVAFSIGWTPCIGPVLGLIIAIAGSEGGGVRGAFLMACFALGLGVPFVLLGLGMEWAMRRLGWVQRHYRGIAGASGVLLILVGVLLMTGLWAQLVIPIQRWAVQIGLPI